MLGHIGFPIEHARDLFRPLHVALLLTSTHVAVTGIDANVLYRILAPDRRDGFANVFKFLFTRDRGHLIIPTSIRRSTKFWKLAYLAHVGSWIATWSIVLPFGLTTL